MDKNTILLRKRQTIADFLDEVRVHEAQFSEPCPSRILAAKFAKRVIDMGGYRTFLRELEADGTIHTLRLRTGAILISLQQFGVERAS